MQGYAHAQSADLLPRLGAERSLGSQGSGQGLLCIAKRGVERIAGGSKNDAAMSLDRQAQNGIVAGEGCPHSLGVLFPQAGAALDIGENKSDSSSWRFSHLRPPYDLQTSIASL